MNPPKTFSGVYPSLFVYVMLSAVGLVGLVFLTLSLVNPVLIFFFLFDSVFFLLIGFIHRNNIRSVTFFEDHVVVLFILFPKETIEYRNLRKYLIKIEGFNNKTISTLLYQSSSGKIKSVDFRTASLDHQQFKEDLIQLKRSQLNR